MDAGRTVVRLILTRDVILGLRGLVEGVKTLIRGRDRAGWFGREAKKGGLVVEGTKVSDFDGEGGRCTRDGFRSGIIVIELVVVAWSAAGEIWGNEWMVPDGGTIGLDGACGRAGEGG